MKIVKLLVLQLLLVTSAFSCHQPMTHPAQKWHIELKSDDIGLVRTIMTFDMSDSTFTAESRPNADRDILGFWKSTLGRCFTHDFKHGALLHIVNGKIKRRGDSLLLSGIFSSALGNYYFNGSICRATLAASLTNRSHVVKGTFTGTQQAPAWPLCNYPALMEQALQVRNANIYNKQVLSSSACRDFDKTIRRVAKNMQDDVEMEFAFFYYAGKLPFSHFSLLREFPSTVENEQAPARQLQLVEKTPGTAYLRINSFSGTAAEVDSVFEIIQRRKYANLVVDLRDNPGGSVEAGMQFARWVSDSSYYGGVFLTQKWFDTHAAPPQLSAYRSFPQFTESNYDLLMNEFTGRKACA